jgi:hypothetical protein
VAASAEIDRPPLTPSGRFPTPDDPRVREWVARFGGRSMQVGFRLPKNPMPIEDKTPVANGVAHAAPDPVVAEPAATEEPAVPTEVAALEVPVVETPEPVAAAPVAPAPPAAPKPAPPPLRVRAAREDVPPKSVPSSRQVRRRAAREQRRRERAQQRQEVQAQIVAVPKAPAPGVSAPKAPAPKAPRTVAAREPQEPVAVAAAAGPARSLRTPMVLVGAVLVVAVAALLMVGRNSAGPHSDASTASDQTPATQQTQPDAATKSPVVGPEPPPTTITPGLSPTTALVSPSEPTRSAEPPPQPEKPIHSAHSSHSGKKSHGGELSRDLTNAQYAIVYGHYSTNEMAKSESDYLSRLVPLQVRASRIPGTRTFHIVLGRYESSEEAERALQRLQHQGLVEGAKVTKIARWTKPGKSDPTDSRHPITL